MLMSTPLKYLRRNIKIDKCHFNGNMDTFRKININLRHGLRRKVSLVL